MLSHLEIRRHVERAGLGKHADALLALLRPCVRLQHARSPSRAAGSTRLGGAPDLPADVEWPRLKGAPLAFIGQLALADVAGLPLDIDLPADGLLSFFYDAEQSVWGFDPADAGGFRVIHSPAGAFLRPVEHPRELPKHAVFPAVALTAMPSVSLPSLWRAAERLGLTAEERDGYFELLDVIAPIADGPQHQVGGHAAPIQDDMELECQLVTNGLYCGDPDAFQDPRVAALTPGAQEWRLLLQIDSDEDADMIWGDAGMLYFWMRDADIAAQRFDRAWMILQCS